MFTLGLPQNFRLSTNLSLPCQHRMPSCPGLQLYRWDLTKWICDLVGLYTAQRSICALNYCKAKRSTNKNDANALILQVRSRYSPIWHIYDYSYPFSRHNTKSCAGQHQLSGRAAAWSGGGGGIGCWFTNERTVVLSGIYSHLCTKAFLTKRTRQLY